ncbi:MAG TPA: pyridoxal phosphate-dependent aminotransferase [Longimicrobiales bacterium]
MQGSQNVRGIEGSATLAIAALCRELRAQGREVIDLGVGEPDFRTPEFIAEAGIASIEQGFTQYTPVPGIPALRKAIAERIRAETGKSATADGVVVTSGAKQAIFNACFVLFGPGDKVLIPSPYWTSYPALVKLARADTVFVKMSAEQNFRLSVKDLDAHWSEGIRGLIINSPSNPTGAVYTLPELDAIARWANERKIWIISDEIYGRICFTADRAASLLDLDESLLDRVVIVDGASKTYAMTGWRLGYSYSHPGVAKELAALQSQITSNAASPSQYAALAAYQDDARGRESIRAMVRIFQQRRDKTVAQLATDLPKAEPYVPGGAFYLFVRVDEYFDEQLHDSATFCAWLLDQTGVALVPGSAFGDDRYVRLSLAAPNAALAEAVRRAGEALEKRLALTP